MRIVRGADEARNTVTRRAALEPSELPLSIRREIRRVFGAELSVEAVVERILTDVWAEGDVAVQRYNGEIDGSPGNVPLAVSDEEVEAAYEKVDAKTVAALRFAAREVERFHEQQRQHSLRSFHDKGLGQVVRPLERVGVYVPGTTAVYPSTVLMTAIPAKVAGVKEVVMVTPPQRDGSVSPLKLVAAHIAGVGRVFRAGGVQGIGAMAYGTQSVPRVDKICGPGNVFVAAAKKRVFGLVGIDGVFGPSETFIVADEEADPYLVACDLLAAAEHDELATAILITTSEEVASTTLGHLQQMLDGIERPQVARAALEARGGIAVVGSLEEALELADEFAPEHLCLHAKGAQGLAERVRNAGCIFVGSLSVESIGDYTAGPSHVMPTAGSARYASPLGVHDFLKVTSVVAMDAEAVAGLGPPAATIARAEGFKGHAQAIEARLPRPSRQERK